MTTVQYAQNPSWDQTSLWSELNKKTTPEALNVRAFLIAKMPEIEKVLAVGGTAALDFTLHDAGHSFRVAERMAQIIPTDVLPNLSTYELALLLLSAYLHDIGMTPEQRKVEAVYGFLLTNNQDNGWAEERKEFEKWLDEAHPDTPRPLDFKTKPHDSLQTLKELVTEYSRHRHNDWSEEWIRKNFSNLSLGTYSGWTQDLITLCRSHHEVYSDLVGEKFDPRYVGSPAAMVHLRYLAAALRIADVLELDPERTPAVILRHRDIRPSSLIYWWKDAEISIRQEAENLSVYARPLSAKIHRAVEATVEQINIELLTCRKLADHTHFENCPGTAAKLPHHWGLPSAAIDDIRPKDNSYVYIDGSFRPDTRKLLQLLSGVELYGSEMVAIRELLQNSFDAIRELIAYERLASPEGTEKSVEDKLAELNRVELRLEFAADGTWLVCKDTGVGMNKSIIKDHLLVSGVGGRYDVLELERKCSRAGFSLGRTGQFGIGVLSYFMLADQVAIRTKRSPLPGDAEANGWRFETEGVGSFGELRRDTAITKGTEVRLRLRPEKIASDPAAWFSELSDYIQSTLLRVPCQFKLTTNIDGCQSLQFSPGFVLSRDGLAEILVDRVQPSHLSREETPTELLSMKRRREKEQLQKHWDEVSKEFNLQLRLETEEGQLPDGLGNYRIHLPYFESPGGATLAFLRASHDNGEIRLRKIGRGYCYVVNATLLTSWKGMRTGVEHHHGRPSLNRRLYGIRDYGLSCTAEIDWVSSEAGKISVSRNAFAPTEKALVALQWLEQRCHELQSSFLKKNHKSVYATLNNRLLNTEFTGEANLNWITFEDSKEARKAVWKVVHPPFINALSFPYEQTENLTLTWNSNPVSIVPSLSEPDDNYPHSGLAWCSANNPPEKVIARVAERGTYSRFELIPFWAAKLSKSPNTHVAGVTCAYPPEWKHLCGAQFEMYSSDSDGATVWNQDNSIVKSVNASAWEWSKSRFQKSLDPLPHKASLLTDIGKASSWIILSLVRAGYEVWDGLKDRDPDFLADLWTLLFGPSSASQTEKAIYQWVADSVDSRLRILTAHSWTSEKALGSQNLHNLLPVPKAEWCLFVRDERAVERIRRIKHDLHRSSTRNKPTT